MGGTVGLWVGRAWAGPTCGAREPVHVLGPAGGWMGRVVRRRKHKTTHRCKVSAPAALRRASVQTGASHPAQGSCALFRATRQACGTAPSTQSRAWRGPRVESNGRGRCWCLGMGGVPRVRYWAPVWECTTEEMAVGLGEPASRVLPQAVLGRLCLQGLRRRGHRPPSLSPQVSQPALARAFNPLGLYCPARSRVLLAGGALPSSSPWGAQGFCLLPSGRPNR